ncbi:MAG: kynureninase [Pseudomonadota bacterium]
MAVLRKDEFHLPEGIIYLDGNSLGPLPKTVMVRVQRTVEDEWGEMLIRAWNDADWMQQVTRLGDRIAPLIGAPGRSVVVGDTLSIKVFQALSAALQLNPHRKVVLSDSGNFPTDLYMAEGLIDAIGGDVELKTVAPEVIPEHIDDSVAVLMLTHVDYRTGRMHDMVELTRQAHAHGVVVLWDLAHSAGAVPLDLGACRAEFAVGCTYKYLNGGPGAPAFIYVRPDIAPDARPILSGWLGHADPFAFEPAYRAGDGIERMRVGTPAILQMAALDAALDVWESVSMGEVREQSIELTELFINQVESLCPELALATPRNPVARGSQVSFSYENAYPVVQALIAEGVIGDFRAPNIMRFGFAPLYIDEGDVRDAASTLARVLKDELWRKPEFNQRSLVT